MRVGNINDDIDALLNGIRVIMDKKGDCHKWTLADILYSILTGNSLFLINDADIAVAYTKKLSFSDEIQLWIWLAYSESGDAFDKYMDDFKELANKSGCKSIGFSSNREGYRKISHFEYCESEYRVNL